MDVRVLFLTFPATPAPRPSPLAMHCNALGCRSERSDRHVQRTPRDVGEGAAHGESTTLRFGSQDHRQRQFESVICTTEAHAATN